VDISLVVGIG